MPYQKVAQITIAPNQTNFVSSDFILWINYKNISFDSQPPNKSNYCH